MLYLHWEMISRILVSLNCPALLASRAHLGRNPMSWTVKTVALKSGAYWSSKGQLMNTLR